MQGPWCAHSSKSSKPSSPFFAFPEPLQVYRVHQEGPVHLVQLRAVAVMVVEILLKPTVESLLRPPQRSVHFSPAFNLATAALLRRDNSLPSLFPSRGRASRETTCNCPFTAPPDRPLQLYESLLHRHIDYRSPAVALPCTANCCLDRAVRDPVSRTRNRPRYRPPQARPSLARL
jgi:hypothetical protein